MCRGFHGFFVLRRIEKRERRRHRLAEHVAAGALQPRDALGVARRAMARVDRRAHLRRLLGRRDDVLHADADAVQRAAAARVRPRRSARPRARTRAGSRCAQASIAASVAAMRASCASASARAVSVAVARSRRRPPRAQRTARRPRQCPSRTGSRRTSASPRARARSARKSACRSFRKRRPSAVGRITVGSRSIRPRAVGRLEPARDERQRIARCARRRAPPARRRSAAARSA